MNGFNKKVSITFRVTRADKDIIRAMCRESGLTFSELVRASVFNKRIVSRKSTEFERKVLKIRAELASLGNLLKYTVEILKVNEDISRDSSKEARDKVDEVILELKNLLLGFNSKNDY